MPRKAKLAFLENCKQLKYELDRAMRIGRLVVVLDEIVFTKNSI